MWAAVSDAMEYSARASLRLRRDGKSDCPDEGLPRNVSRTRLGPVVARLAVVAPQPAGRERRELASADRRA
jgi:hypothetical protein